MLKDGASDAIPCRRVDKRIDSRTLGVPDESRPLVRTDWILRIAFHYDILAKMSLVRNPSRYPPALRRARAKKPGRYADTGPHGWQAV